MTSTNTPGITSGPYVTEELSSENGLLEEHIFVSHAGPNVSITSAPLNVNNAEVYNGTIPGPTLRMNVGDTAIIRLVNNLDYPTGIHWHGIELANTADGTPVTQRGLPGGPGAPGTANAGGTYLYKFTTPRPGIFWYHPHHFHSTNRVFRGLYGMIVVTDPAAETPLIASGTLPDAGDTVALVLSDTTVCPALADANDPTYQTSQPWLLNQTLADAPGPQPPPTPGQLGYAGFDPQMPPQHEPLPDDPDTMPLPGPNFSQGDIVNIQRPKPSGSGGGGERVNEGQTVLTNGFSAGGRAGNPDSPGALDLGTPPPRTVLRGQGVRLQIVNCATSRYYRLRLTEDNGDIVNLVRVGGEAGLLNEAILEGGGDGMTTFETKYNEGEILLPPAVRADVVAAIPTDASGTLTLWTMDYSRTGQGFTRIPTVPVMLFDVDTTTSAVSPAFSITAGTGILSATPVPDSVALGAPTGGFLDPSSFGKTGSTAMNIQLTQGPPSIDGVQGGFGGTSPYSATPNIAISRWADADDILEITVENTTFSHHPFHLHGFSFQPISLTHPSDPDFVWPFVEFRDTVDIPAGYTLTFRVHVENARPLLDGNTPGGGLGRWLFHCHIFHHAHGGMLSELVVSGPGGAERPYVDVNGSWDYAPLGGIASRTGTFHHRDGLNITLTSHLGDGAVGSSTPFGTVTVTGANTWEWTGDETTLPPGSADQEPPDGGHVYFVYVTGTDTNDRRDQAVFRVKFGGADDGADNGDPHIRTLAGQKYDFQAVGEFVLFRDREGMEVQTRQTPVATQNPITDSYTGLKSCVSINTAVAARVGSHRIAYQPTEEPGRLQFYLDGKPLDLTQRGIDVDGHRISSFDANGAVGLRVDYAHYPVLQVTPKFWNSHQVWYMNVKISQAESTEGLMAPIPQGSWLPPLSNGVVLGSMPESLTERWQLLYTTFADSWRVTDASSLFVYASGTSTASFTDRDWPSEEPPCKLKPEVAIPNAPVPAGMPVAEAEQICQFLTNDGLRQDCVFDVATTGDPVFAEGYRFAEHLELNSTAIRLHGDRSRSKDGEEVTFTAIVRNLNPKQPTPTGQVVFEIDGAPRTELELDAAGRARLMIKSLGVGEHTLQARFRPDGDCGGYDPSESPKIPYTVTRREGSGKPRYAIWIVILAFLLVLLLSFLIL